MLGRSVRLFLCILTLMPSAVAASVSFTNRAVEAGVANAGASNGAAFGDFNSDGWPDLLVGRFGGSDRASLYRSNGDGTFTDQGEAINSENVTVGGAFVDLDADGDLDIYQVYFRSTNQIFLNDEGSFSAYDLDGRASGHGAATGAAFGDFDQDGTLDVFTLHRFAVPNQFFTRLNTPDFADQGDHISSLQAGVDTYSAAPFDFDNDGDLDLYVSSLDHPNLLHRNDGSGAFHQMAEDVGVDHPGTDVAAIPSDFDNDGDLDLYLLTIGKDPNALYRNSGDEGFEEVAAAIGLDTHGHATGGAFADFDNDGDLDLLVSNIGPAIFYQNDNGERFDDVSSTTLPAEILHEDAFTAGVAASDYDLDGDVDVFIASGGAADYLLNNDSEDQGHYLTMVLESGTGRQPTLGARLQIRTSDGEQIREHIVAMAGGTVYGDLLHFGLGASDRIQELTIDWPSGQRQVLVDIAADQVLTVAEPHAQRDLQLRVISPDLAPRWEAQNPEVEVTNAGASRIEGATVLGRIGSAGRELYREEEGVPTLEPGASARVRFPTWRPSLGGEYDFSFDLQLSDDLTANNSFRRTHHLYSFRNVAADVGVADTGKGWAGAFSDFDNDGDLDLYLSNGGGTGAGANVLYRNDGAAGFTDVTGESGTSDDGNGTGVVFADFDRDGSQDLFIAKGGFLPSGESNRLFHNNGDGTFADISTASGLDEEQSSYFPAVGDYDQDGYSDLYVSQLRGQVNRLYHNEGDGTFTDVTQTKRILSSSSYGAAAATFADYDNDGDTDLFASFFGAENLFYENVGDTTYQVSAVVDRGLSTSASLGDYDSDGDLDIYLVARGDRSVLLRNDLEVGAFADVGAESGTENLAVGTGSALADYDNDGDLDLFVSNSRSADRLYANLGGGGFIDVAAGLGIADTSSGASVLLADYDNDGDLDLYQINEEGENRLYENGGSGHNWLQVKARGVESNADGIGTRLSAHTGDRVQMRELNGGSGFSHNGRVVQFGLRDAADLDSLVLRWPSGQVDVHRNLAAGVVVGLVEGGRSPRWRWSTRFRIPSFSSRTTRTRSTARPLFISA